MDFSQFACYNPLVLVLLNAFYMQITWHGHSCFTFKGKAATLLTDPIIDLGVTLPKLKADVILVGDEQALSKGKLLQLENDPKVIDWPGEFEVAGISIEAFSSKEFAKEGTNDGSDTVLFIFSIDGVKICHLSGLAHELSSDLIERIGDIDILLLPVGGGDVLDAKLAQSVMEGIEPRLVIPMYFDATPSEMNIRSASEFLKLVGKTELDAVSSFDIKLRGELSQDNMQFVLLEPAL